MTRAVGGILLAVALAAMPAGATERLQIAPPHAVVSPGGTACFQAAGSWSAGTGNGSHPAPALHWLVASGPGGISGEGTYRAPYVVPQAVTVIIRAVAGPQGAEIMDEATVELLAGSYPGADSCAGVGQDHFPAFGEYVKLDELPEAIHAVQPVYPASARAHDTRAGLVVNVLVCRSGHVLDAYAVWSVNATPIKALEDAALDAARLWVFKPGTAGGQPMASWVAIPFKFPP